MSDDDDNLATAPIPKVIESIREHDFGDQYMLLGLYLNTVANRLEKEHERANTESARVQYLVDHWPGELLDGGITFPDGELVYQTGRGP